MAELGLMSLIAAQQLQVHLVVGGVVALVAGLLILFVPRLLRYVIGLYLLYIGVVDVFHIRF